MNKLIIPLLIFSISYALDIVLIPQGKVMSWSLMEVEGLCGVRLASKHVNNASEGNLVSVAGGWGGGVSELLS